MRTNDLILKTTTTIIAFLILAFSFYLFLAGHNAPGGGFIGGLMTSGAFVLMYLTYGFETMDRVIIFNFRTFIPIGLSVAVLTGVGSFFFDVEFLSHTFEHLHHIPLLGDVEVATAMLFDLGVYLTVIGVTMTIILSIAEDAKA